MEQIENIDIRATPELQLIAEGGRRQLDAKAAEAIIEAFSRPEVKAKLAELETAQKKVEKLATARKNLAEQSKKLDVFLRDVARLDDWITAAAEGKKPDSQVLAKVGAVQAEATVVKSCLDRINTKLMPLAQVSEWFATGEHEEARAVALDLVAHERAQRLMEALRAATDEEVSLKVDVRSGVAGLLLQRANQASEAAQAAQNAGLELANKHHDALEALSMESEGK